MCSITDYSYYEKLTEEAKEICEKYHLNLLHVPESKKLRSNLLMQEKLSLLSEGCGEGWGEQKAAFQWAMRDPELKDYMKDEAINDFCLPNEIWRN